MASQIAISEAGRLEPEDGERREEGLRPLISEPDGGCSLAVGLAWLGEPGKGRLAEGRVQIGGQISLGVPLKAVFLERVEQLLTADGP